jgi:hypothetical protein
MLLAPPSAESKAVLGGPELVGQSVEVLRGDAWVPVTVKAFDSDAMQHKGELHVPLWLGRGGTLHSLNPATPLTLIGLLIPHYSVLPRGGRKPC